LNTHLRREDGNAASFTVQDPTGRILPYNLYGSPPEPRLSPTAVKGEQMQYFDHPTPGVWQFTVKLDGVGIKAGGEANPREAKFSTEFAGYRVDCTPSGMTHADNERTVTFENKTRVELTAHVSGLGLGSSRDVTLVLTPALTAHLFDVDIADGTKRLEIALEYGGPSSWVGLYMYKAPEGPNKAKALGDATPLIYEDSSHAGEKHWVLESPNPGRYIIAVDPLHVPPSGLKLHYRDIVIHPAFGEVSCTSSDDAIAPMATKLARLSWTIRARPVDDRKLVAECALISQKIGYSEVAEAKVKPEERKLKIVPVPLATQTISAEP
jgi:hypothetical protein